MYIYRKTLRLIESTDKKLINAELALLFNETCKKFIYMCSKLKHIQIDLPKIPQ